jgi:hypothetical protein
MWSAQKGILLSLKKEGNLPFVKTWMNLEGYTMLMRHRRTDTIDTFKTAVFIESALKWRFPEAWEGAGRSGNGRC